MNLHEKILARRKKAGLSQEELAEKIGVSRQAVSKWETGEALPELNKIIALADVFAVTTDWLLKDGAEEEGADGRNEAVQRTWIDALPTVIGRLVRSYGWMAGVYLAFTGLMFTAMGALARYMVRRMMTGSSSFSGSFGFPSGVFHDPFEHMTANNPVSIMGGFIMGVGLVMLIGGIIAAVFLKRRSGTPEDL